MQLSLILTLAIKMALCAPGSDTVYNISFTTLSGTVKTMQEFQGRKVLVVVLAPTIAAADSALIVQASLISRRYTDLIIIAVPSLDDGIERNAEAGLLGFYRNKISDRIFVTQPMHTRRGTGTKQHDLFNWLTNVERNSHFDEDVDGVGQVYAINEQGELYAVGKYRSVFSDKFLQRIMQ